MLNWNDYTSCIRYYLRLSILHVLMNFVDTTHINAYFELLKIKCKYRKDVSIPVVVIVIHHVKGPVKIESVWTHLQIMNAY